MQNRTVGVNSDWPPVLNIGSAYLASLLDLRKNPEELAIEAELACLLWRWVSRIPQRQQMLIREHYVAEKELKEIAISEGTHWSRMGQLHTQALNNLRRQAGVQ